MNKWMNVQTAPEIFPVCHRHFMRVRALFWSQEGLQLESWLHHLLALWGQTSSLIKGQHMNPASRIPSENVHRDQGPFLTSADSGSPQGFVLLFEIFPQVAPWPLISCLRKSLRLRDWVDSSAARPSGQPSSSPLGTPLWADSEEGPRRVSEGLL